RDARASSSSGLPPPSRSAISCLIGGNRTGRHPGSPPPDRETRFTGNYPPLHRALLRPPAPPHLRHAHIEEIHPPLRLRVRPVLDLDPGRRLGRVHVPRQLRHDALHIPRPQPAHDLLWYRACCRFHAPVSPIRRLLGMLLLLGAASRGGLSS